MEVREHASTARDGQSHAPKFPKKLVPLLDRHTLAATEKVEQFLDPI